MYHFKISSTALTEYPTPISIFLKSPIDSASKHKHHKLQFTSKTYLSFDLLASAGERTRFNPIRTLPNIIQDEKHLQRIGLEKWMGNKKGSQTYAKLSLAPCKQRKNVLPAAQQLISTREHQLQAKTIVRS